LPQDAHTITAKGIKPRNVDMIEKTHKTKRALAKNRMIICMGNICGYCRKEGHWKLECEMPHDACNGLYCQL
jgi:hypothetical protein